MRVNIALKTILMGFLCITAVPESLALRSAYTDLSETSVSAESIDLNSANHELTAAQKAEGIDVQASVKVLDSFQRKFAYACAIGKVDGNWVRVVGSMKDNYILFKSLPKGTWDFYSFFTGTDGVLMLSREDMEVPLTSEMVFDENDATIEVDFDFVLPDGSTPMLPLKDTRSGDVTELGNIAYEGRGLHFTHTGMQLFAHNTIFTYRFVAEDGSLSKDHLANRLKTNGAKHADASRISQYAWIGGVVHIQKGAPMVSSKETNKASDFIMVEADFKGTALNQPDSVPDLGMTIISYDTFDGKAYLWNQTRVLASTLKPEVYGKVYYYGPSGKDHTRYMRYAQPGRPVHEVTAGRLSTRYAVMSLPFRNSNGKPEFIGIHNSASGLVCKWTKDASGSTDVSAFNPWLTYIPDGKITIGNSTATTVMAPLTQNGITPFEWGFTGIHADKRETDNVGLAVSLTLNGDTIAKSKQELTTLFSSWGKTPPEKGKMRFELINNNILIDTVRGSNHTVLEYASRGDDSTPPVLQIMRPVQNEKVTDRITDISSASIDFIGGDYAFNYEGVANPYYTDFGKVEVTAEYAPSGSGEFKKLDTSELTERFWMPGWGHYFRAPLASLGYDIAPGWYDIRISLTDKGGNTHCQTFSPAIYIHKQNGIETPEYNENRIGINVEGNILKVTGTNAATVRLFNMGGQLMKQSSTLSMDLSGLSKGIYIVEISGAEANAGKVLKITI